MNLLPFLNFDMLRDYSIRLLLTMKVAASGDRHQQLKIGTLADARRYLRVGKQLLVEHLSAPEGRRLPALELENAMCRGFGYDSLEEIRTEIIGRGRTLPPVLRNEHLAQAFMFGFFTAFGIAERQGFSTQGDRERLAVQLAWEAVVRIRVPRKE
jgi:hypothetical protein